MTDKKDEALKLALQALEYISSHYMSLPKIGCMALAAVEEALAQPDGCQCPACKVTPHASDCAVHNEPAYPKNACDCGAQPEQEQGDSNCQNDDGCPTEMAVLQRFWRGEPIPTEHYPAWFKPAQQREPVAWTDLLKKADEIVRGKIVWKRFIDGTPLANDIAVWMADFAQQHTSPPASKPWVGLTQEDMYEIGEFKNTHGYVPTGFKRLAAAIEAKLREKNA